LWAVIHRVLETTRTLQHIELDFYYRNTRGDHFSPIAQGIINCTSICGIKIRSAYFDEGATNHLLSILQNKENLESLTLDGVSFGVGDEKAEDVVESISAALTRPGSSLRSFELHHDFNNGVVANENWLALFRAVAKSKLNRFKFGVSTAQILQSFTAIVPSMRVQELEVSVSYRLHQQTAKEAIFRAIGKNFSLRSVKGSSNAEEALFRRVEDQRKLTFYINRNERLDEWVDNRTTLDRKLWPEALGLAAQAGKDTLFRSLQSVQGSDYVNQRTGRKRKRTQFYSPGKVGPPKT